MNSIDALNEPIKFTVAGKTLGFRRLSSIRQMALSESYIIEQKMKRIKSALSCLDAAEKSAYMDKAMLEIKDEDVHKQALKLSPPPELVCRMIASACDAAISGEDVALLFDLAADGEMKAVMAHVYGVKGKADSPLPVES
jgi:hypothetical protein